MIQKTFGIYSDNANAAQLVIELGKQHLSCWQEEKKSKKIYAFELFHFEKYKDENSADIFRNIKNQSEILSKKYAAVKVVWENEMAVIIPKEFQDEKANKNYLKLVAGNAFNTSHLNVFAGDIMIGYFVDEEWNKIFQLNYVSHENTHKYGMLVNAWVEKNKTLNAEYLWVLLYQSHFVVMVFTKENLLLATTFFYKTPEDVLYHLLNICERLQLNKNEAHFSFAGLIDVESNLFKTLEAYLRNIFFIIPSAETLAAKDFKNYPEHYFSSFLNIFP